MAKTATAEKTELTDEGQAAYDARVAAQAALGAGTPESKDEKPKATRKTLTPEEKIAKLEAELKAAREKAEAKTNKAKAEAVAKRAALVEKRDALTNQIKELTAIIGDDSEYTHSTGEDTES